jgi:hypothetical protein
LPSSVVPSVIMPPVTVIVPPVAVVVPPVAVVVPPVALLPTARAARRRRRAVSSCRPSSFVFLGGQS